MKSYLVSLYKTSTQKFQNVPGSCSRWSHLIHMPLFTNIAVFRWQQAETFPHSVQLYKINCKWYRNYRWSKLHFSYDQSHQKSPPWYIINIFLEWNSFQLYFSKFTKLQVFLNFISSADPPWSQHQFDTLGNCETPKHYYFFCPTTNTEAQWRFHKKNSSCWTNTIA